MCAGDVPSEMHSKGRIRRCGWPGVRSVIERSFHPINGSCAVSHVMPRMASYDSSAVAVKPASNGIGAPFEAASEQVVVTRPAARASDPSASRICRSDAVSSNPHRRAKPVSMNTSEAPLSSKIVASWPANQPRSLKKRASGLGHRGVRGAVESVRDRRCDHVWSGLVRHCGRVWSKRCRRGRVWLMKRHQWL